MGIGVGRSDLICLNEEGEYHFGRGSMVSKTDLKESLPAFWSELKRRRVIRVVILYAVAGWIVIEVASTVLPNLNLPEWTVTLVTALVVLGFIIAIMLAWAFDIGPGGVHRTPPQVSETPQHAPPEAAPVATDEARGIEAGGLIAQTLHHHQAHHGLAAAQVDAALVLGKSVSESHLVLGHRVQPCAVIIGQKPP